MTIVHVLVGLRLGLDSSWNGSEGFGHDTIAWLLERVIERTGLKVINSVIWVDQTSVSAEFAYI